MSTSPDERRVVDGDDQAIQAVDGVEEEIDQVLRDGDLPHAQPVEHVLEAVRQLGDVAEPEHPGQAFEGVHLAKDLVDQLRPDVLPLALELDQVTRKRVQQLLGLAGELFPCPIVFSCHRGPVRMVAHGLPVARDQLPGSDPSSGLRPPSPLAEGRRATDRGSRQIHERRRLHYGPGHGQRVTDNASRHAEQAPQLLDQIPGLERLDQVLLRAQCRGAAAVLLGRLRWRSP